MKYVVQPCKSQLQVDADNIQSLGVTQFKNPSMSLFSPGPYQDVGARAFKREVQDMKIDDTVKGSGGSRHVSEKKHSMQFDGLKTSFHVISFELIICPQFNR